MLGSIDCMHWEWRNCPKSLHGQFKRRDHKYPTLMLEAVADQKLWIWHAYFRVSGENNDLNVLYGSSLFDDEPADKAPECPFVVNGHTYKKCYYLADDIYLAWATFVKTFSIARDEKTLKFKRVQESARKDVERAFRVLQDHQGWLDVEMPTFYKTQGRKKSRIFETTSGSSGGIYLNDEADKDVKETQEIRPMCRDQSKAKKKSAGSSRGGSSPFVDLVADKFLNMKQKNRERDPRKNSPI
nr:hypothetical protein [Tanacetum cinerariifolium]